MVKKKMYKFIIINIKKLWWECPPKTLMWGMLDKTWGTKEDDMEDWKLVSTHPHYAHALANFKEDNPSVLDEITDPFGDRLT